LTTNGGSFLLEVAVGTSLAQVPRERIGLVGTKIAGNEAQGG